MLASSSGRDYEALSSLEVAKKHADGVVILEGDYGGQIYVVCPAHIVECDSDTLELLLRDLDAIAWACNKEYPTSAGVYFERLPTGATVSGGMGGGLVTTGLWVHGKFVVKGLEAAIAAVIEGREERLPRQS